MQPPGLLYEMVPKAGMSDGDEVHSPLPNAFPVQVGYAVFCDHIMNVAPGEGDPGAFPEERHNAGYQRTPAGAAVSFIMAGALGRGGQSQDGSAARCQDC